MIQEHAHLQDEQHEHDEFATSTGVPNRKMAFWVFLASEAVFFAALIGVYLSYSGLSKNGPYPLDLFDIPLTSTSTFVLLMSSLTMVLGVSAVSQGDLRATRLWLAATALLGIVFLGFQAYEFSHFAAMGLGLGTNLFGSAFYTLTGFHGAHVLGGVLWILALLGYSFKGGVRQERALDVELAGLYWHFVDVVWIVIFTVVYLLELTA